MEIKVCNNKLEDYNRIFKVRRMNYDQILVNYPYENGLKAFKFQDVQLISESKIDEFLINNREYLKIKLKRGISIAFYSALKEIIELEINEKTKTLDILIDKYKINKRGIWEKDILLFFNEKIPINIIASGQNFKRNSYNINIAIVENKEFLELCDTQIAIINKKLNSINLEKTMFEKVKNQAVHNE